MSINCWLLRVFSGLISYLDLVIQITFITSGKIGRLAFNASLAVPVAIQNVACVEQCSFSCIRWVTLELHV